MSTIEITPKNFKEYLGIKIVAFSFAHAGAMGEGGGITILASDGKLYHTNFIKNISLQEAIIICPILEGCHFNPIRSQVPEGWSAIYMGFGNFLIISDIIKEGFLKKTEGLEPYELYKCWKNKAQDCL